MDPPCPPFPVCGRQHAEVILPASTSVNRRAAAVDATAAIFVTDKLIAVRTPLRVARKSSSRQKGMIFQSMIVGDPIGVQSIAGTLLLYHE